MPSLQYIISFVYFLFLFYSHFRGYGHRGPFGNTCKRPTDPDLIKGGNLEKSEYDTIIFLKTKLFFSVLTLHIANGISIMQYAFRDSIILVMMHDIIIHDNI